VRYIWERTGNETNKDWEEFKRMCCQASVSTQYRWYSEMKMPNRKTGPFLWFEKPSSKAWILFGASE